MFGSVFSYLFTTEIHCKFGLKKLGREQSSKKGFVFGVKSEQDQETTNFAFLRQTDQNTACLLDFIGRQTRGRCLIPSSSLEFIFDEYKASPLNNHKIYLFKRDDDIFINFNFISKSNKRWVYITTS